MEPHIFYLKRTLLGSGLHKRWGLLKYALSRLVNDLKKSEPLLLLMVSI